MSFEIDLNFDKHWCEIKKLFGYNQWYQEHEVVEAGVDDKCCIRTQFAADMWQLHNKVKQCEQERHHAHV